MYDIDAGLLMGIYDAKGGKTNYTYNALRELSSVSINVLGLKTIDTEAEEIQLTDGASAMNVSYAYESGRLSTITYGDCVYVFTYDKWGNILAVTMNAVPLVTYDYGEEAYKGLVHTITYGASSRTVYYTYNALGQVSTVGYAADTPRFEYCYTSDGTLSSIYDIAQGKVTQYTEKGYKIYKGTLDSVTQLLYKYEGDEENYTEMILEEAFQYSLETEEDLSWLQVLDEAGAVVYSEQTAYDVFERLTKKVTKIGSLEVTQQYSYVVNGSVAGDRVKSYGVGYLGENIYEGMGFTYTYDPNGNIIKIDTRDHTKGIKKEYQTTYTYDEAGQLTGAYDEAAGIRYAYSYDKHGNLMSKESYSVAEDETESLLDQTIMEYDGMVLKNSYSSVSGKTQYQYQAGKYLRYSSSSAGAIAYRWGEGRMLQGLSNSINGMAAQYSYNEEGLRTQKQLLKNSIITTTDYVWGKNGLAGFTNGEDTVVVLYGSDGMPVGFTLNGDSYAYIKNLQGDVLRILDTDGNTVVEYTYDPWGAQTVTGDIRIATINPCSYRCYDYDEESGLYYLQSRYYNPETGRFLNADDTEYLKVYDNILNYNIFAYCKNNPTIYEDPTGTIAITTCVIIGVVAGAIIGGVASKMIYGKVNGWWVLGGAVIGGFMGYGIGFLCGATSTSSVALKAISKAVSTIAEKTWNHIITQEHAWNLVMKNVTRKSIRNIISNALKKGEMTFVKTQVKKGVTTLVYEAAYAYKGQTIIVHYGVVEGVIKISDAWVKTR